MGRECQKKVDKGMKEEEAGVAKTGGECQKKVYDGMNEGKEKADGAEIPYHLWREHIEHVIPRISLPDD